MSFNKYVYKRFCVLIMVLILLSGCSSEKKDWEKAESENTIDSLEVYIEKYPNGAFIETAKQHLEELYYKKAETENTVEAHNAFLQRYPEGAFVEKAKLKLQELELENAKTENTIDSFEAYIKKYPDVTYTETAKQHLEELYYNKAKSKDTFQAYKDFIGHFPEGKFVDNAYHRIQEIMYKFKINILSTSIVKMLNGLSGTWEVKDPAKTKGVILKLKLDLLPGVEEIHTDDFRLAFESRGVEMIAACSGSAVLVSDKREGWWVFAEPGSRKQWIHHPKDDKKVHYFSLLYAVPIDINQIYFTKDGVQTSKSIPIE